MPHTFEDHWITETLRLRESLWGPLEDSAEAGRARAEGGDFATRVFSRSRLLARRERLDDALSRWRRTACLALIVFAAGALLAGGFTAAGALGPGTRPVNLALAVTALLGLNTLTFLMWLLSFGMRGDAAGSLLADAWLGLTRRLARGPDFALLPRALLELLARNGMARWSAGALSHALWALALIGALATLLALLAARRYTFQWETTLLSPDTFVVLTEALGWLPSLIGFPQPGADIIRASGAAHSLPEFAHARWSTWLLGVVVVYGLLPRFIALFISSIMVARRRARLALDPSLPGITELHDRLMPASQQTGVDAPAPRSVSGPEKHLPAHGETGLRHVLGLELPDDLPWPPLPLTSSINNLGVIDTRDERRRVMEALRRNPPERLLVSCDARQTPDRGILAQLNELASLSGDIQVLLLPHGEAATRRHQWRQQLLHAGFNAEQLPDDSAIALGWLEAGMEDSRATPRDTTGTGGTPA